MRFGTFHLGHRKPTWLTESSHHILTRRCRKIHRRYPIPWRPSWLSQTPPMPLGALFEPQRCHLIFMGESEKHITRIFATAVSLISGAVLASQINLHRLARKHDGFLGCAAPFCSGRVVYHQRPRRRQEPALPGQLGLHQVCPALIQQHLQIAAVLHSTRV